MKKAITLAFVFTLLLSACGQSAPATISSPEVAEAPTNTSVPEATATPISSPTPELSPTPEITEPYAIISADKAKFVFPMPAQEEWEWFVVPNNGTTWEEYFWYVNFKTDKDYEFTFSILNYKNSPPQKGGLDEMLKAVNAEILEDGFITDQTIPTYSIYAESNLVTIEITGQAAASLYASKLESIFFSMSKIIDYSDPSKPVTDFNKFDVRPTYE